MLGGLPGVLLGRLRGTRATAVPAAHPSCWGRCRPCRELDHHVMFTPAHGAGPGLGWWSPP